MRGYNYTEAACIEFLLGTHHLISATMHMIFKAVVLAQVLVQVHCILACSKSQVARQWITPLVGGTISVLPCQLSVYQIRKTCIIGKCSSSSFGWCHWLFNAQLLSQTWDGASNSAGNMSRLKVANNVVHTQSAVLDGNVKRGSPPLNWLVRVAFCLAASGKWGRRGIVS